MADLSIIYSKTPRGLRARASLVGGLSSHLMKVLSLVDGTSKAETILLKFDHLTPETLLSELAELEKDGYIKVSGNTRPSQEWSPTVHFTPMVVEEYQSEEELETIARAKEQQEAKLAADRKANAEAAAQREIERKAQEEKALIQAKSKAKAEAKMKALLEAEAKEAEAREAERIAKETEALRIKAELEAKAKEEERVKAEQEEKRLVELKAREAEAQAKAKAEAEAKERALQEAERIAKEAEALRIKAELEAKALEEERAKAEQEEKRLAELKAREVEAQAKAKAEAEAKERALQEADRIAKEVEELRIKTEAEAKKKEEDAVAAALEADLKAKAEIEAKSKDKEKAHLEIERVLREAEEKRKKTAKKAKEEKLEAKRKAKAEEEAKKAQRKSKEEIVFLRTTLLTEEKAKSEEKEINRITIEKIAKEAEDERISRSEMLRKQEKDDATIDELTSEELRLKAVLDEEEREKAAAKEKSRTEMERIAKEADAMRKPATILKFPKPKKNKKESSDTKTPNTETIALSKMEERARKEAERIAKEEQELAEIEAEEKALKNTKKFENTEQFENTRQFEKTKQFAKTFTKPVKKFKTEQNVSINEDRLEKQEKEAKYISNKTPSFKLPTKIIKAWILKLSKIMLVYLPLALILVIGVAHFVNLSMLAKPVESLLSENLKDAVTIQEVRISLLPEPHFVLGNVSIGKNNGYKIDSIYVVPTRASLFEDEKVVESAVIEGMQINHTNFTNLTELIKKLSNSEHLKIEDLHLKNIAINIRDVNLGVFDGKLKLSESRQLEGIDLISTDNTLNVSILSSEAANNLILNAHNWALPLGPKVVFSKLSARGIANQEGVSFTDISGELYDGSINARLLLDWSSQWQVSGNVDLTGINAMQMLTAVNSPTLVEGKLKLSGNFSSKTTQFNKVVDDADISADFEINNGSIRNVELARAVIAHGDQSLSGDDTHFDKLAGSLQVKNAVYQYRKVVLLSPQFRASGYFDVMPNQFLSGKVSANLQAQSRRLQANFSLEGTSNNARSK